MSPVAKETICFFANYVHLVLYLLRYSVSLPLATSTHFSLDVEKHLSWFGLG